MYRLSLNKIFISIVLSLLFKKMQNSCICTCGNNKKDFNSASVKICFLFVILFRGPFFYFPEKFSPPQNGEFFESQKEEHFHFSKNSPGETGTSFCLKKEFEHRENGRKEIRTSDLYS